MASMADNNTPTAIEIDIEPVTGTPVRLGRDADGNDLWYTAHKPKAFQALELSRVGAKLKGVDDARDSEAAEEVVRDYLGVVFGEKDADALMARIKASPQVDGLDLDVIQQVTQKLFGDDATENPTMSSSGTPQQPGRTGKTSKGTRSRTASKSAS